MASGTQSITEPGAQRPGRCTARRIHLTSASRSAPAGAAGPVIDAHPAKTGRCAAAPRCGTGRSRGGPRVRSHITKSLALVPRDNAN